VFEPADEYKGDFARTYFYMVTCYEDKLPTWYSNNSEARPTLDGRKYPGLSQWQLQMLLEWAALDPVSDKELQRNEAVWGIQHNRNPFIDYPGLEQYIWGDKTSVPFSYDGSQNSGIVNFTATSPSSYGSTLTHDLQGRTLNASYTPTRGIYIRGGKKYIVR
jgi:hypothetical protein